MTDQLEGVPPIDSAILVSDFRHKVSSASFFANIPNDYSPALFRPEVIKWGQEDYDRGISSSAEKVSLTVASHTGGIWNAVRNPDSEISGDLAETLLSFSNHAPIFVPVEESILNESTVQAARAFGADEMGMILMLNSISKFGDLNTLKHTYLPSCYKRR